MDKLKELKEVMHAINEGSVTTKDLQVFIATILEFVKNHKNEFLKVSQENLDDMQSIFLEIEKRHDEILNNVDKKTAKAEKEFSHRIQEVKSLVNDVKSLKFKDGLNGKDGKDADEERIIASILSTIRIPESKQETGKTIIDKINELPADKDNQIDASHIKNLPKSGNFYGGSGIKEVIAGSNITIDNTNLGYPVISSTGGGGGTWGSITGTLSDQTDLQNALNAKQDTITTGTTAQYFRGDLSLATFPTLVSSFTNDAGYITSSALSGYVPNTRTLTINGTAYDLSADRSWTIATPTASTGLTNTSGTWTSNLSTGIAGGQSVIGGTASGNNLTLSSTSNATKGKILFGTSAYDEVNDRLGIGTNAPSAKLEVRGISDFWGLQVGNGSVGALFQVYGGNAGFVGFNGSAYNSLDIRSGISTQLFLATNGKVGIGTNSPSVGDFGSTFTVKGTGSEIGIITAQRNVSAVANGTGFQTVLNNASSNPVTYSYFNGYIITNTAGAESGGLMFFTRNAGTLGSRMTILNDGNTGIGTTSPTAVLHLKAGTATASTAPLKFTSGTNLTTAEAGAMEYDGTSLYFSPSTTRRTVVLDTATQTLTNKRINPRVQAVTSASTVTPSADNDDEVVITAQGAALTLANWSGTPVQGQAIIIRIKDDGTARAITFDTLYRAVGAYLPTTTVIGKTVYIACIYNSTDTKIDVVSVAQEI